MEELIIGEKKIEYDIVRSNRKTMGITINPDKKIIVRSPENITKKKIHSIVQKKSSWILNKLEEFGEIKPPPAPKEFLSGEKLPYLGRRYRIKTITDSEFKDNKVKVKLYKGKFIIKFSSNLLKNDEKRIDRVRDELVNWYRKHAEGKINERVNKYKPKVGVKPNKVKVKKQKKRWGSCSSKNNLNFNWKIIMAPMSVVDYIVVHELVHLKHPNHSKDFWELVETIIPGYKDKQEWLKRNGPTLTF